MDEFDINEIKRKNLKRIMKEHGLKGVDLAKKLGVSKSYISNLMKNPEKKGSRNIGDNTLEKLSSTMEIDKREFFMDVEEENKPIPMDMTSRIINNAERRTGKKLTPKQRQVVIKIIKKELEEIEEAEKKSTENVIDLMSAFFE